MTSVHYALIVHLVGTVWTIEPLTAIGLVAVGLLYAVGVRRLARKGRRWPARRTLPFLAGLLVIAIATQSPLAAQDTRSFTAHIIQHLLLAMASPILLCLGAPITLVLQAAQRTNQQRLLRVLHSPPVRLVTFPVVSWMLFIGFLFVLYYSSLYPLTLRNAFVHELVHVNFVLVGFLFFSPIVAIDPHPWKLPHGGRLLYMGLTLPAHAFLALALLSARSPIALSWYLATTGRTFSQILTDQKLGAGIMWVAGDLLSIATVAIVVSQWIVDDERSAAREDRYVDLTEGEGGDGGDGGDSRVTVEAGLSGRSPSNLG